MDLYKDQLKGPRARTIEYPFDDYFDQQMHELQDTDKGDVSEELSRAIPEEKKDLLSEADTGGPPPPVPGFLKGTLIRIIFRTENANKTYSAASSCASGGLK